MSMIFWQVSSVALSVVSIFVFEAIYKIIAAKLTAWENWRTRSQYEDALVIKNFIFAFVNNYCESDLRAVRNVQQCNILLTARLSVVQFSSFSSLCSSMVSCLEFPTRAFLAHKHIGRTRALARSSMNTAIALFPIACMTCRSS
jgi:hypothetical protein